MCLGGLDDDLNILPRRSICVRDRGKGQGDGLLAPNATPFLIPVSTATTHELTFSRCGSSKLVHERYLVRPPSSQGGKVGRLRRFESVFCSPEPLDFRTTLFRTSLASKGTDLICVLRLLWLERLNDNRIEKLARIRSTPRRIPARTNSMCIRVTRGILHTPTIKHSAGVLFREFTRWEPREPRKSEKHDPRFTGSIPRIATELGRADPIWLFFHRGSPGTPLTQ